MTNHANDQIRFPAARTVLRMYTHKCCLFLINWDLNLANKMENWSK